MTENQKEVCSRVETPACSCGSRKVTYEPYLNGIPKWVVGVVNVQGREVPQISTILTWQDLLGTWKARWGAWRMKYAIPPGLYAVGNPDPTAVVWVTANYKMSFDRLRKELTGINCWILVLDTKGINVWCAAGKGTFGTNELVKQIQATQLAEVVTHRTVILPQLGAPGVSGHEVQKLSGFKVVYGPVRADDIPEFIKNGLKATEAMREVKFGIIDRLVLTPIELVSAIRPMVLGFVILFGINLAVAGFIPIVPLLGRTVAAFIPFLGAVFTGAVLVPVLLPYIPGRAFAWKGWLLGIVWAGIYIGGMHATVTLCQGLFYLFILPPISSYLALNFTGATVYTSLSGVMREMRVAIPALLGSAGLAVTSLMVGLIIKG